MTWENAAYQRYGHYEVDNPRSFARRYVSDSQRIPFSIMDEISADEIQRNADIIRNEKGDKVWKCKTCGHHSKHKHNFINHYRRHTGEKPYSCSHCSYSATQKHHLHYHMLSKHKL